MRSERSTGVGPIPEWPTILTACAVVDGMFVRSSVVSSQVEVHAKFGGVVPELASRHHLDSLAPVIRSAIEQAGLDQFPFALDCHGATASGDLVPLRARSALIEKGTSR